MVSKTVSIIDPSVTNTIAENQVLSVSISDHGLEASVFNSGQSYVAGLECWDYNLDSDFAFIENVFDKIYSESILLKKQFSKIIFLLDHPVYTLIPDQLFVENKSKKYLEFNHSLNSGEKISIDHLNEFQLRNIYWMPYEVVKTAEKTYNNAQYCHVITPLILSLLKEKNANANVILNFSGRRLDVLVFKESRFVFCNSFFYESHADIIYFLMNVFTQTSVSPSSAVVKLCGEIKKDSAELEIISKYFSNISFAKPPSNFNYHQELLQIPLHNYYGILKSFKCAL